MKFIIVFFSLGFFFSSGAVSRVKWEMDTELSQKTTDSPKYKKKGEGKNKTPKEPKELPTFKEWKKSNPPKK